MRNHFLQFLTLSFLTLICTAVSFGQAETGRLQGKVTDPSGAAVANATVTVTNTDTNHPENVTTNDDGEYLAAALPRGHYRVEIAQQGFKKVSRELELQVGQIGVADFHLEIGAATEVVNVTAGSPVVDAADSTISEVVESPQITELPINGRDFTEVALLAPGVTRGVPTGSATGVNNNAETFRFGQEGGAALSVNGLRPQNNDFTLDGVDNNETLVNSIVFFPPADAIDQFQVNTSVAPAQYGRGGAQVVTSLKSGSNDFHGSVFWFNRNTQLNARDFFNFASTQTKPPFERNQFGVTAGGPIIKNKLFIFGDFEGLRLTQPGSPGLGTVPTDPMRTGDFSQLLCGTPAQCVAANTGLSNQVVILDPTTGTQFMGTGAQPNVIPQSRINPVGLAYLKAFPEPNCSHATNASCGSIINNYVNTMNRVETWNDFDIRADYVLNNSNTIFARVSRAHADQVETTFLSTLPSGFGSGTNFNHPYGAAVGWTDTLSASLINEARIGFDWTSYGYMPPGQSTDICTTLGIVNCNTPLLGGIALIGGFASQIEYTGDFGPYLVPQTSYDFNDTLTWVKGHHTLKFGGDIVRRELNLYRPIAGKGYFELAGNGNSAIGCGSGHVSTNYEVSDLLAGFVDATSTAQTSEWWARAAGKTASSYKMISARRRGSR